ncbi:MAG TPA: TlpA disulfide reductase family protein [Acidimicrobiales bacterium]
MDAPADGTPADPPPDSTAGPAPRRRLPVDGRTLGICVCIALVMALIAGLITASVTHKSSGKADATSPLLSAPNVDRSGVLTAKVATYAGRAATITPYVGKPTVVNLWSSTCTACIKEMPAIDRIYRRQRSTIGFVGVDVEDHSAHDGEVMLRRTKASYPTLWDRDGTFLQAAAPVVLPTTLFLDRAGNVVYVQSGAMSESKLQHLIATKLH